MVSARVLLEDLRERLRQADCAAAHEIAFAYFTLRDALSANPHDLLRPRAAMEAAIRMLDAPGRTVTYRDCLSIEVPMQAEDPSGAA